MGKVQRAILRRCGMRPLSEKKKVIRISGSATVARMMWLASKPQIKRAERGVNWVADVAVQRVVRNVSDEKQCGECKCRNHRGAMLANAARADECVADEQGRGGKAVENGIHRRKEGVTARWWRRPDEYR